MPAPAREPDPWDLPTDPWNLPTDPWDQPREEQRNRSADKIDANVGTRPATRGGENTPRRPLQPVADVSRDHDRGPSTTVGADERAVVASVLSGSLAWDDIRHLRVTDFDDARMRRIWTSLHKASLSADAPTPKVVSGIDRALDAGMLASLAATATTAPAAKAAASRLVQRNRKALAVRKLHAAAREVEGLPPEAEAPGAMAWQTRLTLALDDLAALAGGDRATSGDDLEASLVKRLKEGRTPVSTGIKRLDEFLGGGLRPGTLLAIGGQPKTGKTVFLASVSFNLEMQPDPVPHAFISLAHDPDAIARLKLARRIGVAASRLGDLSVAEHQALVSLRRVGNACRTSHLPGATLDDLKAEAAYHVKAHGARAILVDYLQLVEGRLPRETDEGHMTRVAQGIQVMACDLKTPVILAVAVDDMGQVWRRGSAIKHVADAYLVLNRDRGSEGAYLETHCSNLGDEADIGTIDQPSMSLHPAGPHFE